MSGYRGWRGKKAKQGSKYRNVKTEVDGRVFASKKEARRYCGLKLLEKVGAVQNLRCQVRMPVDVNGHHICDYIADFVYDWRGAQIVEDVKGYRKGPAYQMFILKRKLIQATLGVLIVES